jgi:hypothetical protein
MGKESSSSSSSEEEKKEKKNKTKTKKPKQVISNPQSFSKRYAHLFNNQNLSDFTITVGSEKIFSHKFILSSNSDFFENLLNESSFTFPSEEDSSTVKSLIKFYYDGVFEYTEDSAVFLFTLLANKVRYFNNVISTKLKTLENLNYQQK